MAHSMDGDKATVPLKRKDLQGSNGGENLGGKYTEAADDDEKNVRTREADMLYSVAEGHLEDEAADEALNTIKDAVTIFRDLGDSQGLAESLRLQTKCYKAQAEKLRGEGKGRREEKVLREAEAIMRDELSLFRDAMDKRGEASMLMAVGELITARAIGSGPKLAEAHDYLLDAQDIAREIGETKLEALIAYNRCNLLQKRHRFKPAIQAAREAQKLFHAVGDSKYEGLSWFALGAAQVSNGQVEDGFVSKRKALSIYKRIGNRKLEGMALCLLSECYLMEREDYALSIKAAQEANAIFKELGLQSLELQAHGHIVTATSRMKEYEKAISIGKDMLEIARGYDLPREIYNATKLVAQTYLEFSHFDAALDTADELFSIARDIEDDPRYYGRAHYLVGEIHDAQLNYDAAEASAVDAVKKFEECYRFEEECFHALQLHGRIKIKLDDFDSSLELMNRARAIATEAEDAYLEGFACLGMSGSHWGNDDLDQAIKAANLACELFREEGYQRGEARVIKLALADYHMDDQNPDQAIKLVKEGAKLMEEVGDNKMLCQMRHRLAVLLADRNKHEESAKTAMEALKLARMEEDKRSTAVALFAVLEANNAVLLDTPMVDRDGKAFRQSVDKMARYAKESLGLAVKLRDSELESVATLWVAKMHLLHNKHKEAITASESAVELARECNEVQLGIDARLVIGTAQDALGETKEAITTLKTVFQDSHEQGYDEGIVQSSALLEHILGAENAQTFTTPLVKNSDEPAKKPEVFRAPQLPHVRNFLRELVRNIIDTKDSIDSDARVMESGLDSLASVELRTQLQGEFRVNLPASVLFQYPTVNKLAALLVDECTTKRIEWRS